MKPVLWHEPFEPDAQAGRRGKGPHVGRTKVACNHSTPE